jgi:KUP system potassium uptake protein
MQSQDSHGSSSMKMLMLGAVGVVFGDIGTSPLYTLKECFKPSSGLLLNPDNIMGILSLIFWAVFLVVSLKYVTFVMRADNNGEGGILSLISLADKVAPGREKKYLILIGLFGAAMFYGDGVITPAISVLSAVEGLEIINPKFHSLVIPFALAILVGLFWVQKKGTGEIGKYFGPVMLAWFGLLGIMGLYQLSHNWSILYAINPWYAVKFIAHAPMIAFLVLGAVVLALTGGEALYADMGHFGRTPIKYAWFGLVLPCLMLNYFGQGALVMANPTAITNPFYSMAPAWGLVPLVILATFATVIASQAVISGAFSMTKQAIALGYMPRLTVVHTSEKEIGQIYVPFINTVLFIAVVLLVLLFKTSDNLASAYGIAVTTTMLIDTVLVFVIMKYQWKWANYKSITFLVVFAAVDTAFLTANSVKIIEGGWFPLALGGLVFFIMTTWKTGRGLVRNSLEENSLDLDTFMPALLADKPYRVAGTAVFLNSITGKTPVSFMHNLKHNKVLHEKIFFFTMQAQQVPYVKDEEKVEIMSLGNGVWKVIVKLGFKELPDVPQLLKLVEKTGLITDWIYEDMDTSFFLSRETILSTPGSGLVEWREKMFGWMSQNATKAALYFNIPPNRVIELGAQVCI